MNAPAAPASPPLRLRPPEPDIDPSQPFTADKLERKPFVDATVELIRSIREPFVIALNAPWGSGKTTTLKLLEPALRAAGVTSLRFNAWEVDDATDPLVPLVATVHDRLLAIKGYGDGVTSAKVERWKNAGIAVAKHGTIALIKAATAGLIDAGELADGAAKAAGEAAAKAGDAVAGDLIETFKRERKAGGDFSRLLGELIAYLRREAGEDADPPPLVLVIDELDRCRPTFAVAMLERIKHFFAVEGLVFVLAVDLQQLEASTCKVYGEKLDAREYLRRFVDLELALPTAQVGPMVDAMLQACGANALLARQPNEQEWLVTMTEALARHFGLSLRLVQRMVTRMMLVVRQSQNSYLHPVLVTFMIFLRVRDPALLRRLVRGQIGPEALMRAVHDSGPQGAAFVDSYHGRLVEAYLHYACKDTQETQEFLKRAVEASAGNDYKDPRLIEVGQLYENVRRQNFSAGRIRLETIDRRINLVAMDLMDKDT